MIRSHSDGTIITFEIDNPPHNQLAPADIVMLGDLLEQASYDSTLTAVILTGHNGDFCGGRLSGGDTARETRAREFEAVLRIGRIIDAMPQIVVAAIEGRAWGLGLGLTIQSDVAIASRDADFALPELSHGLPPMIILTYLNRFVPYKIGLDWVLSGRTVGIDELMRLGVVSRDCETGDAYREAVEFAQQLTDRSEPAKAAKLFSRQAAALVDGTIADRGVREIVAFLCNGAPAPSSGIAEAVAQSPR